MVEILLFLIHAIAADVPDASGYKVSGRITRPPIASPLSNQNLKPVEIPVANALVIASFAKGISKPNGPRQSHRIEISEQGFKPRIIIAREGDDLVFTNSGKDNITPGLVETQMSPSLRPPSIDSNGRESHTITVPKHKTLPYKIASSSGHSHEMYVYVTSDGAAGITENDGTFSISLESHPTNLALKVWTPAEGWLVVDASTLNVGNSENEARLIQLGEVIVRSAR